MLDEFVHEGLVRDDRKLPRGDLAFDDEAVCRPYGTDSGDAQVPDTFQGRGFDRVHDAMVIGHLDTVPAFLVRRPVAERAVAEHELLHDGIDQKLLADHLNVFGRDVALDRVDRDHPHVPDTRDAQISDIVTDAVPD